MKNIHLSTIVGMILSVAFTSTAMSSTEYKNWLGEAYPADGPGGAVIVIKDSEVLFRDASGLADIELDVPLTPENVFRLGSITKQFTAAAIMLLEEQDKLSVNDDINKYLPDYPTQGHTIMIENLLSHTSGIFNYTRIPDYFDKGEIAKDLTTEELIEVFAELPMDFAPGEQFRYSNSGYVLLGAIIEKISGVSYAEFIQTSIFEKLEMNNSYYGGLQIISNRANGYKGEAGEYSNAAYLSMSQPHAAGALLSTVDDLAIWNSALFDGEFLSNASIEKMTTAFKLNNGKRTNYGFGFAIGERFGEKEIAHTGSINGFSTSGVWLPGPKVYVAVLSNIPSRTAKFLASRLAFDASDSVYPKMAAINIHPDKIFEYQGVYRINKDATHSIIPEDGHLYIQRTGSGRDEIIPHAEDAFFIPKSFSHMVFKRDREGKVNSLDFYLGGTDKPDRNERESDLPIGKDSSVEVSAELYDLWEGSYLIEAGQTFYVRREESRLLVKLGGQSELEAFPMSTTRYFYKLVDAEIEFTLGDDGRGKTLTLYQNGAETVANRVD